MHVSIEPRNRRWYVFGYTLCIYCIFSQHHDGFRICCSNFETDVKFLKIVTFLVHVFITKFVFVVFRMY